MQERTQVALAVLNATTLYSRDVVDAAHAVVVGALGVEREHDASTPRGPIVSIRVSESNGNGPDGVRLFSIVHRYENDIHVHSLYTADEYAKLKTAMLAIEAQPTSTAPVVRPVTINHVDSLHLMLDEHGSGHGRVVVRDPRGMVLGENFGIADAFIVEAITIRKIAGSELAGIALVDPEIVP